MTRFFRSFLGFITLLTTFAMLYIASGIYTLGDKISTTPYFLRHVFKSRYQTEIPVPTSEVSDIKLKWWLLQKYVVEYFYVSPIAQDMERHHETLRLLSSPAVYNAWKNNMMQQLNTMSSSGFYRQITVSDDIVKLGDFYLLEYELKTWTKPNNMSANPDITHGKIYLKIGSYTGDIYDDPESIQQIPEYLNSGADPAPAFNFRISAVDFPQGAK